jgi:hypothetical protein
MNWDIQSLNFVGSTNAVENRLQKALPAEFLYSDIQYRFEVSEGSRPAEPFIANRYAPVLREIRTEGRFHKGIVIPKGTILSALPIFSTETYQTVAAPFGLGGASGSVASGELALGIGYDATLNAGDMNDMIEGYDILRLAGMIANGGTLVKDPYTTYDTSRARVGTNGALVSTSDTFTRPANIPIGFVTTDIYLFDTGAKLNFTEGVFQRFSSFSTEYFVEMPYIAPTGSNSLTTYKMNNTESSGTQTMGTAYAALRTIGIPFLTATEFEDLLPGTFISPDLNGKYKVQNTGSGALTANRTAQTIGRLISVTNKFPQDMEGMVETYSAIHGVNRELLGTGQNLPVSKVGGTATYGLDYILFVFAWTVLYHTLNGVAPTYAQIKDLMNSGAVGIARVNISAR